MLRIGAHVDRDHPLAAAEQRAADLVQVFLGDPQGWKKPAPLPDGATLAEANVDLYVHAPYVVNLASTNNRIRIPSRKILSEHATAAAESGAKGLIVHGGHVTEDDDIADGFANWRKTFEREGFPLPVLIENTAGGDNACARRFDSLARLWDAVGEFGVGLCLDTCHAHAAGEELLDVVDRVRRITGRIDLVHCNNSKDDFGSGRDRHENLAAGRIDPELLVAVVRAAAAPVVCETPGDADDQSADLALLRAKL